MQRISLMELLLKCIIYSEVKILNDFMKIFNSYRDSIFIKDHVKSKHIIDKEKEQLRYEILEKNIFGF
ncbi:unknown [Rickettsia conorii str. Malish 7]|uniref:Uncharacterized protein n=4 Tax=spotted fever group TaxID=114277 RepID=Q92HI1_RICCN|nr:unknown [Rickettsia conorii str. Malish 7]